MSYCGETTFVKYSVAEREATTLLCRSWTCETCKEDRKRQLIAQAHRGHANTFVTLTCRRGTHETPNQAASALAQAWRTIHKRAIREASRDPKKTPHPHGAAPPMGWPPETKEPIPNQIRLPKGRLEYLVVIEAHASGWPHLHILCRSMWIAHEWLSAQMAELLDSPICFVQRITQQGMVAAYVAKYCGKCAHRFGTTKRYWQSRGYQISKWQPEVRIFKSWRNTYRFIEPIHMVAARWRQDGWSVTFESAWHLTASPPCKA
jgi:hypothetical protein